MRVLSTLTSSSPRRAHRSGDYDRLSHSDQVALHLSHSLALFVPSAAVEHEYHQSPRVPPSLHSDRSNGDGGVDLFASQARPRMSVLEVKELR